MSCYRKWDMDWELYDSKLFDLYLDLFGIRKADNRDKLVRELRDMMEAKRQAETDDRQET